MKGFNKLIFPCLIIAHIIIRFGLSDQDVASAQTSDQLICSFEEQLHNQEGVSQEEILAIIE